MNLKIMLSGAFVVGFAGGAWAQPVGLPHRSLKGSDLFAPALWRDIPVLARCSRATTVRALVADDSVLLLFDTRRDLGRGDSVMAVLDAHTGQPYRLSLDGDGVQSPGSLLWQSQVRHLHHGWQAIMRIPFTSLPHPRWSLGVGRDVPPDTSVPLVAEALIGPHMVPPDSPAVPVLTETPAETSLTDTATVKYAVSPQVAVKVTVPDQAVVREQVAAAPIDLLALSDEYRPLFQTGGAPEWAPPFQEAVTVKTGDVSSTVGYQRQGDDPANSTEGPSVALDFNRQGRMSVGAAWTELSDADGTLASETATLNTDVRLANRLDISAKATEQDTAHSKDDTAGATLGYNMQGPDHLSVTYSEGTQQGQPDTSLQVAGVLSAGAGVDLNLSYMLTDSLLDSGDPLRRRLWRGAVSYRTSLLRSVTVGVSDDTQGNYNLYGVFRRDLTANKEMMLVLGDPGASAWSSHVLLKIIDRL